MAETFTYRRGAELPGLTLPWQTETSQDTWEALDLSEGHTFTLTLTSTTSGTVTVTKTTGITGTGNGVVIAWATDELDIEPGTYTLGLRARETATNKDRDYRPADPITIRIVA